MLYYSKLIARSSHVRASWTHCEKKCARVCDLIPQLNLRSVSYEIPVIKNLDDTIFRKITHLTHHRNRVDLTHICAGILRLHVTDVQLPRVVAVVTNWQAWVQRHHVCMNRQDRLRIRFYPGHLEKALIRPIPQYTKALQYLLLT